MVSRIFKSLILSGTFIGSFVAAGSVAYARPSAPAVQPICFVDVRSWEDVKAKLPAFMQLGELYAVVRSSKVTGVMKIVQAGRNIVMEAHAKAMIIGYIDTVDTLTQVCVSGTKINVKLANNPSNTLEIVPGGLKTQGVVFTLTSAAGYDQTLAMIPPRKR